MSNTDVPVSFHEAALSYAKRGIPVFPLVQNRDYRVPSVSEATIDLDQIDTWWTKTPDYNIGIQTGVNSGIIVLKFLTTEAWAFAQEKGLPVTPTVKTIKGYHVYCRYKEGIEDVLNQQGFTDITASCDRSIVIAPPSIISNGPSSVFNKPIIYSWVDGKGLDDLELGDVPGWMLEQKQDDDVAIVDTAADTADDLIHIADTNPVSTVIVEDMLDPEAVEIHLPLESKIETTPLDTEELPAMDSIDENADAAITSMVGDWKPPVLFEGACVEDIKAELLPSWLGDFAGAISHFKQTPEGLAVMLGLSIVATCVQKKYVVAPYGDDEYTEQLSLWTVTVMKSGERKSPVLNAMRAPIIAWQKEQAELLQPQILDTATRINVALKRIDRLQQDASKEADADARQKIVDEISEIRTNMPVQVRAPMLWTADVTAESLQDLLAENDERMALLADEGNIFEIMAGLYSDGKVNIDIFLQAYSGSPTKIMRKTRKVDLDNPALTFGLAVQPVVIESFANGSKKQFRGKGALGRFLFCLPDSMLGKRHVGRRTQISDDIKTRYEAGIRRLLSVPKHFDDTGKEIPRLLELDDAAISAWEEFDRRVEMMIGPGGELESMDDWGGKLPGTALRIAGLLHLVEHGPDVYVIGKETLDRSVKLCNLLMSHAKAAFGLIGADAVVSDAKKVFMWMQKNGFEVFTKTECSRALKGISELDNALKALEERNILKELMVPTAGRDAANYISNPILKPTYSI